MVTPPRIIQKNCSRISTCCTPPPPPLPSTTFTETWFARARLRLNNGNAGPSVFLLAEWNTTYDVFLGSKVSLIRAMCDSRKYGKSMMQLNRQMFPGKWGILMLMTAICRCLFVCLSITLDSHKFYLCKVCTRFLQILSPYVFLGSLTCKLTFIVSVSYIFHWTKKRIY